MDPQSLPGYPFEHGRLKFEGKLVVGLDLKLKRKFLYEFHCSLIGGHFGIKGTFERFSKYFFWATLRQDVTIFMRECDTCQQ